MNYWMKAMSGQNIMSHCTRDLYKYMLWTKQSNDDEKIKYLLMIAKLKELKGFSWYNIMIYDQWFVEDFDKHDEVWSGGEIEFLSNLPIKIQNENEFMI